jgi:hypothetical protein
MDAAADASVPGVRKAPEVVAAEAPEVVAAEAAEGVASAVRR